jgi:hypothetical protein
MTACKAQCIAAVAKAVIAAVAKAVIACRYLVPEFVGWIPDEPEDTDFG